MLWLDTSTSPSTWKQRNDSNNGWITLGKLATNFGLAPLSSPTFTETPAAPTAAAGTNTTQIATTAFVGNAISDAAPNYASASSTGYRNALINANPIINQRGYTSGTATTTANQYTLDRWRVVSSGQSISWSDSNNTRTITAPSGGVEQVIEGASLLSGTYTLNWTGTATATIGGTSIAKGGNVSLTGNVDAVLRFSSGTFSLPQLEFGSIATTFERRPYGQELALCQRYFEVLNGRCVTSAKSGISDYTRWFFKATKRVTPTIAYAGGSDGSPDSLTIDGATLLSSTSAAAVIASGSTASAEL
jgi:hypothetical protein